MARVAALLPCSPDGLLDLDLPMFNEVARQVERREREWTRRDEMAAQQIEMTHLLFRTLVAVNSKKGSNIPEFVYPRPDAQVAPTAKVVSHAEMFGMGTKPQRKAP